MYADDVPADGGQAAPVIRATLPRRTITREPKPRVERKPVTPTNQMREVTCTSCFMIVAAERGECSSCGAKLTV